jgi:hypothetical protein
MNAYGRIISKTPRIPNSAPDRAKRPVSTYQGPHLGKSESWFGCGGETKILLFRKLNLQILRETFNDI